jgi:hypothetical protein
VLSFDVRQRYPRDAVGHERPGARIFHADS